MGWTARSFESRSTWSRLSKNKPSSGSPSIATSTSPSSSRTGCRPPAGCRSCTGSAARSMFLLLPFVIWMFDTSLDLRRSRTTSSAVSSAAARLGLPGWFWKLVAFALIWAFLLHFCAGLRHLWMDATHAVDHARSAASRRWSPSASAPSSPSRSARSSSSERRHEHLVRFQAARRRRALRPARLARPARDLAA